MTAEEGSDFSDERTAIMLRRLPPKLATEKLLQVLDAIGGGYDFVYMPHGRQKNRNVALAFVNFVDATRARSALQYFASGSHYPLLGHALRVSQADIQGLGPNLAFFVARFGLKEVENPHAPRVFENGRPISVLEATTRYVTMDLLAEASKRLLSTVPSPQQRTPPSRGYGQASSSSSSASSSRPTGKHHGDNAGCWNGSNTRGANANSWGGSIAGYRVQHSHAGPQATASNAAASTSDDSDVSSPAGLADVESSSSSNGASRQRMASQGQGERAGSASPAWTAATAHSLSTAAPHCLYKVQPDGSVHIFL